MKSPSIRIIVMVLFVLSFLFPVNPISAQETDPPIYPTYIIQPGDTLATIAYQFGLSLDDLITINQIDNPNAITIGTEIILPGMEGISGVLTTVPVKLGDTLQSLTIQYGISAADLIRINKLSSPSELYQNANIILPIHDSNQSFKVIGQNNGQVTRLEMAVLNNVNSWQLNTMNLKANSWNYQRLEPIFLLSDTPGPSLVAAEIDEIVITPEELYQGDGAEVRIYTHAGLSTLTGSLGEYELHFFEEAQNVYVAYQGIYAQQESGLMPLVITAGEQGNLLFSLEQMVLVNDSLYPSESLIVDSQTIDPATMDAEQAMILELTSTASPEKYFDGAFGCMLDQPVCIRSWFGTNRNYNNGVYYNFHSGLDYGVCATLNIYAPADGIVVYTGLLTVRGNTTYIDHGWGIYSGIFHQDQILVNEGDFVKAGQLIGYIGATGRVTGAHLHYEIIMNGVHINPLQWLDPVCQ